MKHTLTSFRFWSILLIAGCLAMVAVQLLTRDTMMLPTGKQREYSGRVLAESAPSTRTRAVIAQGVVEPIRREIKIGAPSAGLLTKILVREGQQVRAGQTIAEIESSSELAAVETARSEVESARMDLSKVLAGERAETIAAARGDLRSLQAKAAQSKEALDRLRVLAAKDLATKDEFDRALRQSEQDTAAVDASRSRLDALANGPRREDVAASEAKLRLAEHKLAERLALADMRKIKSPESGTVLQVKYRVGEYYSPGGDPILLLGDLDELRVRVDVDERDIARITLGQAAYVTAPAFGEQRFPATVVEIGRRIGRKNIRTDDPKERIDTKILEVVLLLDPTGKALLPGLRVTGHLAVGGAQ
jgi:HlyD family secretion protein